jgi:uncharacterized protein
MIAFINEHRCRMAVSMDGLAEYHDRNRKFISGAGSFSVIERNLDRLLETGVKPMIIIVVTDDNLEHMPDFTRYLVERGLKFRYSFIRFTDHCDSERLLRTMHHCYDILEGYARQGYPAGTKHSLCNLKPGQPKLLACGVGRNYFSLFTDGSMHLCHSMHEADLPIGNIMDGINILSTIAAQRQMPDINTLSPYCGACQFKYICAGGCPVDRQDGKSPYCEVFKELIPRIYRLIGLERLIRMRNRQKGEQ